MEYAMKLRPRDCVLGCFAGCKSALTSHLDSFQGCYKSVGVNACCWVSWEAFFFFLKKRHSPIPNVALEGGLRDISPDWRPVAAPSQWAHTDPIFVSIREQMSSVCMSRFIQTSVIPSRMTGGDLRPDICLLQCNWKTSAFFEDVETTWADLKLRRQVSEA